MPCLAVPCLPCRAMLSRAMPRRACRTFPRHSPPCRALRCLPRPSCVPSQTLPRHALPAIHHRSPAVLTEPRHAQRCLACHAKRCPAAPRHAMPSRALPAMPRMAKLSRPAPRQASPAKITFRRRRSQTCPSPCRRSFSRTDGLPQYRPVPQHASTKPQHP